MTVNKYNQRHEELRELQSGRAVDAIPVYAHKR